MRRVCVFCGSSAGRGERYAAAARELAAALVARDIGVVFGGGHIGLMGVLADAALARGGTVIGVIPEQLQALELAHGGLTELHVVDSMHARKQLMADLSDGFLALPGGLGTFEELLEVTTWRQLHLHRKPLGVLNTDGFFAPLLALLDHAVGEGFLRANDRQLLQVHDQPAALVAALVAQAKM